MVDEPCKVARLGCINDRNGIDSEEIAAANAHTLIGFLPAIGDALTDGFADILDDHLIGSDGFHSVQTPAMDGTLAELDVLLTELPG